MDTNLNDDLIKLVRWSVVSVERDRERLLHRGERLVTGAMSGEAFSSWMVAVYLQSAGVAIREEEKKYLRVCFGTADRGSRRDPGGPGPEARARGKQAGSVTMETEETEGKPRGQGDRDHGYEPER